MGSTAEALRAGKHAAAMATRSKKAVTADKTTGFVAFRPKSMLVSR